MEINLELFKTCLKVEAETLVNFKEEVKTSFNNPLNNCSPNLKIYHDWCDLRGFEPNEESLKKYETSVWMYFMYQQGLKEGKES